MCFYGLKLLFLSASVLMMLSKQEFNNVFWSIFSWAPQQKILLKKQLTLNS